MKISIRDQLADEIQQRFPSYTYSEAIAALLSHHKPQLPQTVWLAPGDEGILQSSSTAQLNQPTNNNDLESPISQSTPSESTPAAVPTGA